MNLDLKKPIIFFDLETTGVEVVKDRIVELGYIKVYPNGIEESKTIRFNPECHIPAEATAIHHITNEDVRECPTFKEKAKELASVFQGCDYGGYNSLKFDLPLLAEEFLRADVNIDLKKGRMIDVQTIYHVMEPRNLRAAYRFYCGGKDFENAHSAEADSLATYEVLKAQLDRYSEPDEFHPQALRNDVEFLSGFGGRPRTVDYAGRLILDDDDEPAVNFGKYKGRKVRDVWKSDPSYFSWIEQGEFTLDTKRQFSTLKEKFRKEEALAKSRPLNDKEVDAARELLFRKFNQGE